MDNKQAMRRPPVATEPKITDCGNGIYNIFMPAGFNTYLVLGQEKALLVDTGMGVGSLKAVVDSITSLPVQVLNTHGHPDHAGGNAEFGPAMIHPADKATADRMANLAFRRADIARIAGSEHPEMINMLQPDSENGFIFIEDGHVIDLGGRRLTVHHTPGHTVGSVCVFDEATGTLFGGDTVQPNIGMMSIESAPPDALLAGLKKIAPLDVKRVMYGHNMPISVQEGRTLLDTAITLLEGIIAGTAEYTLNERSGAAIKRYSLNGVNVSLRA